MVGCCSFSVGEGTPAQVRNVCLARKKKKNAASIVARVCLWPWARARSHPAGKTIPTAVDHADHLPGYTIQGYVHTPQYLPGTEQDTWVRKRETGKAG